MQERASTKKITLATGGVLLALFCLTATMGCRPSAEPLPVLGTIDIPYTFVDQDNQPVSQKLFNGRILVADFFFTTCPTICPIMKSQMLRVYEAFKDNDQVVLLSHTIDPEHDTVEVLREYAARLGIEAAGWHMVTGDKEEIYDTAYRYGLAAMEDERAPGGFIHSGSFTLVDRQGRIRGYYQGTEEDAVNLLIRDIRRLLDDA
jgi:protein SCO1/2